MVLEMFGTLSDFVFLKEHYSSPVCVFSGQGGVNYRIQEEAKPFDVYLSHFPLKPARHRKYNWNYTGKLNTEYRQFAPALNTEEYHLYLELISEFNRRCEAFEITYFLIAGSALGAYSNHGFLPWDDDFDVQIPFTQNQVLKQALSAVPGYAFYPGRDSWKFYRNNSVARQTTKYWKWPFIDIFFFTETKTYVYDNTHPFRPRHFYHRSDIFPLQPVIFENMILPAPQNLEAYVRKRYYVEICYSNPYDHKKEKWIDSGNTQTIPCAALFEVYPFVRRYCVGNTFYEELRLGNKTLYRLVKHSQQK